MFTLPRRQAPPAHAREQAFLKAVVDSPGDQGLWLALADWLEEQDDPRRAELLRLHRRLLATCGDPDQHPRRLRWQLRLVRLLTVGVRPCVPRRTVALAEGVEMAFHFIPPGTFLMGSPAGEQERVADETQHPVTLTRGFWLAATATTQAQWTAVMGRNPSHFEGADLPVETVSWEDCQEFCRLLGNAEGTSYRLPSEAEWEYACRSGTSTPFFLGQALSADLANHDGTCPYGGGEKGVYRKETTPVGSFPCNAWGLFDMHGNVWEWCSDWYGPYGKGHARDPCGPGRGTNRVIRGGSWGLDAKDCRAAARDKRLPSYRIGCVGFRVACSEIGC